MSTCGMALLLSLEVEVQDIIWRVEVPLCQRPSEAYVVLFCNLICLLHSLISFVALEEIFRSFLSWIFSPLSCKYVACTWVKTLLKLFQDFLILDIRNLFADSSRILLMVISTRYSFFFRPWIKKVNMRLKYLY